MSEEPWTYNKETRKFERPNGETIEAIQPHMTASELETIANHEESE